LYEETIEKILVDNLIMTPYVSPEANLMRKLPKNGANDTTHFDSRFTNQLPGLTYTAPSLLLDTFGKKWKSRWMTKIFYIKTYYYLALNVPQNLNPFSDFELTALKCALLSATRIDEEMETDNSSIPSPYPNVIRSNLVPNFHFRVVQANTINHREIYQSRLFDAYARPVNKHSAMYL
ncbi:hypothetical protein AGLY_001726, partial [Aphis glycines]